VPRKKVKPVEHPLPPYPSKAHNEIPTPQPPAHGSNSRAPDAAPAANVPPPGRKLRLIQWGKEHGVGTLTITEGTSLDLYALRRNGSTYFFQKIVVWRRGVTVENPHTVTSYRSTARCDCIGFTTHGKCRHASAIVKLTAEGKMS
jgi:hypothetical protein